MKSVTLELENFSPPSNNEIRRMNRWVYRKLVRGLRERIMLALGEGPWPKVTFDKCEHPKAMREAILKELQKLWQPRETVYAETMIRRPRRFDSDNHHGGMKPLWDAIVRAGWLVDDHVKWLGILSLAQCIGDPKTIVMLHFPANEEEKRALESRRVM